MTAARDDYERAHRLIDRLPPAMVRRLLVRVAEDPELAEYASDVRE